MAELQPQSNQSWLDLFPIQEATQAVSFLKKTWDILLKSSPEKLCTKQRENVITEEFWVYLESQSLPVGKLTGLWSYERLIYIVDPLGKKITRIRKDITYFSNAASSRLDLVFEFKKINSQAKNLNAYLGEDGLRRFVDGYYSRYYPLGVMVGIAMEDISQCIPNIHLFLDKEKIRQPLCMQADKSGQYIRSPSAAFADLASFDTEHLRPDDQAPDNGSTLVAHLFLPAPAS